MDEKSTWLQRLFGSKRQSARLPGTPSASSSPEAQSSTPSQARPQITFPRFVEPVPALWQTGDTILGKYEVQGTLGEGGMGMVYKVHDRLTNIIMAVKRPRPQLFTRQRDRENFIREAETWVKLNNHPHILCCYFVEQVKGVPCLFAEYIDGGSLAQCIRERRLYQEGPERALERILDIAIQFAWGLHAAHEQGLVHQDIKPANVLLTQEGIVKVSDFGLAKARAMLKEDQGQAATGQQSILASVGGMTPAYCSPEQAAHRGVTRKTDIWSWAVSVLEMFTGRVIWKMGPAAAEVLEHEPGEVQWAVPMPGEVGRLLRRCLQSEPEARPATMAEVAKELEALYKQFVGKPYPREGAAPAEAAGTPIMRLLIQGYSFAALGRYEEALAIYEQVIKLDPMNGMAHANKGNLLFQQGKYEAALAACEQAARCDPSYPGGYYHQSQALTALGRYEEALTALEQTIRLSPTYAPAHSDKGSALHALERYEEALAAYELAIQLDSSDPIPYRNKGLVLCDLRKPREALAACEQALRLDPAYAGAHMVKGKALTALGKLPEALAALDESVRLDPRYVHAHALRGYVLYGLGRYKEALAACEQALRFHPTFAPAHLVKAEILARLIKQ